MLMRNCLTNADDRLDLMGGVYLIANPGLDFEAELSYYKIGSIHRAYDWRLRVAITRTFISCASHRSGRVRSQGALAKA